MQRSLADGGCHDRSRRQGSDVVPQDGVRAPMGRGELRPSECVRWTELNYPLLRPIIGRSPKRNPGEIRLPLPILNCSSIDGLPVLHEAFRDPS